MKPATRIALQVPHHPNNWQRVTTNHAKTRVILFIHLDLQEQPLKPTTRVALQAHRQSSNRQ